MFRPPPFCTGSKHPGNVLRSNLPWFTLASIYWRDERRYSSKLLQLQRDKVNLFQCTSYSLPRSDVVGYQRFGGPCCLHITIRRHTKKTKIKFHWTKYFLWRWQMFRWSERTRPLGGLKVQYRVKETSTGHYPKPDESSPHPYDLQVLK